MTVSMEYENPPIDVLPMDEDEYEDDEEEVNLESDEKKERLSFIIFSMRVMEKNKKSLTIPLVALVEWPRTRIYVKANVASISIVNASAFSMNSNLRSVWSVLQVWRWGTASSSRKQHFFFVTDRLQCALCQQMITENEMKCGFNQCQRIYHSACLTNSSLTTSPSPNIYYCPLHICATCHLHKRPTENIGRHRSTEARDLLTDSSLPGHLFTCLNCPTAYHGHERCLPGGSLSISYSSSLCCPVHIPFERKSLKTGMAPVCMVCEQTTRMTECLVCTECPATMHLSCTTNPPASSVPNEEKSKTWKCDMCVRGIKPLYGDIGWIKMGKYR